MTNDCFNSICNNSRALHKTSIDNIIQYIEYANTFFCWFQVIFIPAVLNESEIIYLLSWQRQGTGCYDLYLCPHLKLKFKIHMFPKYHWENLKLHHLYHYFFFLLPNETRKLFKIFLKSYCQMKMTLLQHIS